MSEKSKSLKLEDQSREERPAGPTSVGLAGASAGASVRSWIPEETLSVSRLAARALASQLLATLLPMLMRSREPISSVLMLMLMLTDANDIRLQKLNQLVQKLQIKALKALAGPTAALQGRSWAPVVPRREPGL